MIENIESYMDTPNADKEQIMVKLEELTKDLYFISESDYPLEPITVAVDKSGDLSYEELRSIAGQAADASVEVVELTYFLRNMVKVPPETDPKQRETAFRFQTLQDFMLKSLSDVKVYRIGKVEIIALALGIAPSSECIGFKTKVIET
ncbi:nuclease A inhibitor family protein [Rufibacter immobilis]|uniref:nuclease A inhibitor family protein n=1 Tax=Rufibacter immobilis TaxID=1348778 RepID=UPI001C82F284|nr:nuclease A inhibitor family protein [Rufibacter immobilis]